MPKPINEVDKAAAKKAEKAEQEAADLKPKFKTPNEGGSYLISKDDAIKPGAEPVFVEGTDRVQDDKDIAAVEKILSPTKAK